MASRRVIPIPGGSALELADLVLDFNGTLGLDGGLLPGVEPLLRELAATLHIHVLTADTFGTAEAALAGLPITLHHIAHGDEKRSFVEQLGSAGVVAIGNGCNDVAMLQVAALGIAVVGPEGASAEALAVADVVVGDILTALGLLDHPRRLTATLRP
jgi:P-type E1-E2 ATPase